MQDSFTQTAQVATTDSAGMVAGQMLSSVNNMFNSFTSNFPTGNEQTNLPDRAEFYSDSDSKKQSMENLSIQGLMTGAMNRG
jgi:hypothetical protein